MITVFTKQGFTGTWDAYLHDWGGADAHAFNILTYEDLATVRELRAGPIIFSDIERLTDTDRALAADVERVVSDERPEIPILNSPTRTKRRHDLLKELSDRCLNPFRAYRLTDTTTPERFPVFLRYEDDHTGATSGVLQSQAELDRAIVRALIRQHDLRNLIIVEFVDTINDDGHYVKYGAFKVGDAIIAEHTFIHEDWVVKEEGSSNRPEAFLLESTYVRDNPHQSMLRERFEAGAVDYGRIDYSMLGDSLITWEINTNPTIFSIETQETPQWLPRREFFLPRFNAAFAAIESDAVQPPPISLRGVREELRLASHAKFRSAPQSITHFGRRYKHWLEPAVRVTEAASVPFEGLILDRWKRLNGM